MVTSNLFFISRRGKLYQSSFRLSPFPPVRDACIGHVLTPTELIFTPTVARCAFYSSSRFTYDRKEYLMYLAC